MTIFQAAVLGVIQGLSEFLPISSSAHLIITRWFFGWDDPGIAFDVALHWGTLIGVFIYFRNDILNLMTGFWGWLGGKREFENKFPWLLVLGTLPGGLIGLLFEKKAEHLFRSPWIIVATLSGFGLLLFAAEKINTVRFPLEKCGWLKAFFIGASQGIAVIPGVSRSGISVSTGLFCGLERESAVRFSFLLSIPLILGAGLHKMKEMLHQIHEATLWVGIFCSAVSGYVAIRFLMNFIRTKSFTPFVIYRLLLAGVLAGWILTHATWQ